jgi:hypothetical protein
VTDAVGKILRDCSPFESTSVAIKHPDVNSSWNNADSFFSGGRIIVIDNQTSQCSFNGYGLDISDILDNIVKYAIITEYFVLQSKY